MLNRLLMTFLLSISFLSSVHADTNTSSTLSDKDIKTIELSLNKYKGEQNVNSSKIVFRVANGKLIEGPATMSLGSKIYYRDNCEQKEANIIFEGLSIVIEPAADKNVFNLNVVDNHVKFTNKSVNEQCTINVPVNNINNMNRVIDLNKNVADIHLEDGVELHSDIKYKLKVTEL